MKELQNIVESLSEIWSEGKAAAIATVVRTSGSTYRRPGARMLIAEDGRMIGSISGGCLERDVVRQAQRVFRSRQPRLVTYDSTSEDDIVWGFGLGCNGVVDVLIEYLPVDDPHGQIAVLCDSVKKRKDLVLAKVFAVEGAASVQAGDWLTLEQNLSMTSSIKNVDLRDQFLGDALRAMDARESQVKVYDLSTGKAAVFIEMIQPSLPLVIFGAGHDAVPLVRLAKEMGWYVTIVDGRPGYAIRAKFPTADELIVARPKTIESITLNDRAMAVVMNHNYIDDLGVLRFLLITPAKYIGLLGPKRRSEKLLSDLRDEGFELSDNQLSRIHGPVGIDIGADTPEEVALAIVAEIKAVAAGRTVRMSRDLEGPLHTRCEKIEEPALAGSIGRASCGI